MNDSTESSAASTASLEVASSRPAVRVEFAAISHPGKVRPNNEDHYLINRLSRSYSVVSTNMPEGSIPAEVEEVTHVMVVADGMGGMAAGERASELAIRTGVELVLKSPIWTTRVDHDEEEARLLIERMRGYFRQVDSAVFGEANAERHLSGMGTTLTLAYIVGADAIIVHVGDSRAYLFRDGRLHQLTRDHTMAQDMVRAGAIRPEEVQNHAKRHVLTNFVGGPSMGVEPEVTMERLRAGDYLLICSDGLTEMVDDRGIADILAGANSPAEAASSLIARALDRGGRDNVTVVLARCHDPAPVADRR